MFTGIVEAVGRVRSVQRIESGLRMRISAPELALSLALGDSIAVDGVCLTVTARDTDGFDVDAIGATLARTTIGAFEPGRRVNLERALAFGARLGGHLVQGHVDGVGAVRTLRRGGDNVLLDVELPPDVALLTVLHGSIAINGVSLTVSALPERDVAQVALIPYTLQHTNLGELTPASTVNLEGDLIGRFVVSYLERRGV